jgi:hypothetical protein
MTAALFVCTYVLYATSARSSEYVEVQVDGSSSAAAAAAAAQVGSKSAGVVGRLEDIDGVEVEWQKPDGLAKGAVFLAHGCSHAATDFWPKGPGCRACVGLPEEVSIVQAVLRRGFAAVAVSSNDREYSKCWNPDDDLPRVGKALSTLLPREGLGALPLYLIGASSGGMFVQVMGKYSRASALESQIMAGPNSLYDKHTLPTLYTHMVRDTRTADMVSSNIENLQNLGVPCKQFKVRPFYSTRNTRGQLSQALSPVYRCYLWLLIRIFSRIGSQGSQRKTLPLWSPASRKPVCSTPRAT